MSGDHAPCCDFFYPLNQFLINWMRLASQQVANGAAQMHPATPQTAISQRLGVHEPRTSPHVSAQNNYQMVEQCPRESRV